MVPSWPRRESCKLSVSLLLRLSTSSFQDPTVSLSTCTRTSPLQILSTFQPDRQGSTDATTSCPVGESYKKVSPNSLAISDSPCPDKRPCRLTSFSIFFSTSCAMLPIYTMATNVPRTPTDIMMTLMLSRLALDASAAIIVDPVRRVRKICRVAPKTNVPMKTHVSISVTAITYTWTHRATGTQHNSRLTFAPSLSFAAGSEVPHISKERQLPRVLQVCRHSMGQN
mmetsp:Transcript_19684/g.30844  ORF Transcript_19684/g.30844 Transcript_19684/m.30844 type:complete len:226 (+) Transcript_19684:301-978(+)